MQKLKNIKVLKICQLVIAIVLIVVSIALFVYAITSVFGSVAIGATCRVGYATLNEPAFFNDLKAGGYVSGCGASVVEKCLIPNADGMLGASTSTNEITRTIKAVSGISAYKKYNDNFTNDATPQVGVYVNTKFSDLAALKMSDSDGNSNDVETNKIKVNNNKCSSDSMGYNDGTCTGSATGDSDTTGLGTPFCFNLNSYQPAGYPARYSASAANVCTNADKAEGQARLTQTLLTNGRYKTQISSVSTTYNGFYTPYASLFADLKSVQAEVTALQSNSDIKPLVDANTAAGGSFAMATDCRVLRRGVSAIENALCYKVYKHFHTQTGMSFAAACLLLMTGLAILGSFYYTMKIETMTQKQN